MNYWLVLLLFGSLLISAFSRPYQAEYNNDNESEENEDENNEQAAEDVMADEDDSRLNDQEPSIQEDDGQRNRHMLDVTESRYVQQKAADDLAERTKVDNLSDSKLDRGRSIRDETPELTNLNEPSRSINKRRQSDRYNLVNTQHQDIQQDLINREVSKGNPVKDQDETVNKRTAEIETTPTEEGEIIFEKNRDQVNRVEKNEYDSNDASDASEQSRYYKQYYNTMQTENRDMVDDQSQDSARYNLRDRREIKDDSPVETPNMTSDEKSKDSDKTDSENEESAIKRHLKKLSGNELNELLNSLSEDKKELLKKIINDVDTPDNAFINKREITKKAGALEENSLVENFQSDLSKVQGGSPTIDLNTESPLSLNTGSTEGNKLSDISTENNEASSTKTADISISSLNKPVLSNTNDDSVSIKSDSSLNLDQKPQDETVANVEVMPKVESKREANLNDLEDADISVDDSKMLDKNFNLQSGSDYQNDQAYFASEDENFSKLTNDGDPLDGEKRTCKRETSLERQSDNIKSLEESFPNANAYDESADSAPLVRVKRRNLGQRIKKRSAGLLPDAKVAYFPYKAENEDEDNDEGNEFDDEGFYDRTSNFASSNKGLDEDPASNTDKSAQTKNLNADNSKSSNENLEINSMSLGSDTDSVLSGVEGVDENLMYSSGSRNRRIAEDNSSDLEDTKSKPTSLTDYEKKTISENYINAPHYPENDSFGPLPRYYDGDLARYKRIRRVKQSHNLQEAASDS